MECTTDMVCNARSSLEGVLALPNGTNLACLFESPHPEIVFKVKGLEVNLYDSDTKQQLQSMKKPPIISVSNLRRTHWKL